jgi:DNA-directed RNA polymerase specialized sigma24 family protein
MPLNTVSRSPQTDLAARLHAEWTRLRRHPAALGRARRWAIVDGRVDDLSQVLTAVGFEVAPSIERDEALRRLVLLSADDDLAARTVIHRLLPGLLAVTARRRAQTQDAFDELAGAAWISIRTFNPARRPACLPAALIADADYMAFRKPWRRAAAGERPTDTTAFDEIEAEPRTTADKEVAALFSRAVEAGLPDDDLQLLRRLAAATPTSQLAAELDVTPRTVRNRRDRATARLRQIVQAA